MLELLKSEPVALMGALQAVLALVIVFGLNLSVDQTAAIMGVAAAILAVITRSQVSPVATAAPPAH